MQGSPVEIRNAAARRLAARRRYREALDVLNDAIRIDPHYAESYVNRALVFEYLGLLPQADADRRKAAELGYSEAIEEAPSEDTSPETVGTETAGDLEAEEAPLPPESLEEPPEPEAPAETETEETAVIEEDVPEEAAEVAAGPDGVEAEPAEEPSRARRVEPVPRYAAPPPTKDETSGAAMARAIGTLLVVVGLFAAFGVGIYVMFSTVISALDSDDDGGAANGAATETPAPGESVTPTPEPPPDDVLTGNPLSFSDLESGWDSKGITATPGGINDDITGFAVDAVNVTLSRGVDEMPVAVLLYESAQGISQDWTLGNKPNPKAGRSIPSGTTVWYNLNAVTIVLESNDALRQDALDGFLSVNP